MKKLLLLILGCLALIPGYSQSFDYNGIAYKITSESDKTCEVTRYNKISGDIIIPEKVTYEGTKYSVTSIGEEAFYYCGRLTSVVIPNSVTEIGWGAFRYCSSLTSVTIPNSVTSIGFAAFASCSSLTSINVDNENPSYKSEGGILYSKNLKTIIQYPAGLSGNFTIPNIVTSIGQGAFEGCTSLTSITIPKSVTEIGYCAFYGCTSLTSVTIPNSVTRIVVAAFSHCSGLTSITIPNSVTEIGGEAFRHCKGLTSVEIPNSVTFIGWHVFAYCSSLTSINVDNENPSYKSEGGVLYSKNLHTLIQYPAGLSGNFIIPNSVTSIGQGAFEGCSGLTSVEIPNSVTSIGYFSFHNCSGLTSVEIPNSVTSIDLDAFNGCSELTSVTIGNSVTSIGAWSFYGCSKLKSIYIGEKVKSIGSKVFASSQLLEEVVCAALVPPTGVKDIFSDATYTYATLFVPERSMNSYKTLDPWSNFFTYKDISESGVEEIGLDANEALYDVFNLNGQLVKRQATQRDIDALASGIYIIGGKKVIVR